MLSRTPLRSVVLCAALVSCAAWAQDDDLLAPLTEEPAQKPASKPAPKKKAKQDNAPPGEDVDALEALIAPLEAPTELIVNLADPLLLGARFYLDGKEIGPVNGQAVLVKPGDHRLQVKRAGYNDFQGMVSVPHGGREKVVVTLFPSTGVLNVQSATADAEVFVDGKSIGKVPVREHLLKPGAREIKVVKDGFEPEVTKLSVRPGKDYNLSPTLVALSDRPQRSKLEPVAAVDSVKGAPGVTQMTPAGEIRASAPWYGRWYVWAGAAAVAVAGGTVAVMAAQPRTFSPTEVCGQACSDVINAPSVRGRGTVLMAPKLSF